MSTNNNVPVQHFEATASFREAECGGERAGFSAKHLRILGGLLFLALSGSLVGQTHFCIGGDIDQLTPATVTACRAKMAGVRNAVMELGAPADWHFVVVCDEAGWKEYRSFSAREAGLLSTVSYSTDPRLHWTFLRGRDLDTDQPEVTAAMIEAALASIPSRKISPVAPAPARTIRQYGIAMAQHSDLVASTK